MKNFRGTKSLKNILERLKSNVGIFRETIDLFNTKWNDVKNMFCQNKFLWLGYLIKWLKSKGI